MKSHRKEKPLNVEEDWPLKTSRRSEYVLFLRIILDINTGLTCPTRVSYSRGLRGVGSTSLARRTTTGTRGTADAKTLYSELASSCMASPLV